MFTHWNSYRQIVLLRVHHPTFLCLSHSHSQVLLTSTSWLILSTKSGRPCRPNYLSSLIQARCPSSMHWAPEVHVYYLHM